MIWIFSAGDEDSVPRTELDKAWAEGNTVFISPISAWEIGMLVSKNRLRLSSPPRVWFQRLLGTPGIDLAPLTPETLIESSFLSSAALRDPADRIIAATARACDYRVMTRDRPMLDYGGAGHLHVIPC